MVGESANKEESRKREGETAQEHVVLLERLMDVGGKGAVFRVKLVGKWKEGSVGDGEIYGEMVEGCFGLQEWMIRKGIMGLEEGCLRGRV